MDTKTAALINTLAQQRNQALDAVAVVTAELASVREELASAQAKVAELEKKPELKAVP